MYSVNQTKITSFLLQILKCLIQPNLGSFFKLDLPHGLPGTVEEIESIVRETFGLQENFTLHYKDTDFGEEYFSLTSTSDIKDKDT